ncbi:SRPBCC family protein [Nocardioides agariphilus]|jgi:uncharacterized protein YndB with AHSA1/START domain|uniref:SRPBCC family protein n=1 Tax=Nocardioides agariphilus TaxID=433664 RepID=A0A930VQD1_9ACTN|nr:SRPBCC family protein [Nocardioides agariphilus]MBF4769088.1 SRPBCC family protein [Nocardioides agariphilus]
MAHILNRTVLTRWDPDSVFDYLLDFEHAEEWDAGTVSCERLGGDGGVGTRYRNVSKFLGRETTLDYEVEKVVPGRQFVITGGNKTVESEDTVIVTPTISGGTEVEYRARMTFKGIAAVVSPLLTPFLKRLADDTEQQLRATLDAKAAT